MIYREFIEAGYKIFGLHGVENDICGCGNPSCAALFKHPTISNWQHVPLWSDEQLEVMEMTGQLATGYGVLVSGLLVVDVDARNGGVESYAKLVEAIPSIAGAGLIVETGSGGGSKHLYFSLPSQIALSQHLDEYPGIDFKSSGYVVGPGSAHVSGTPYKSVVGTPDDIDAAPAELVELLKKPDRMRATLDGAPVDVSTDELQDMLSAIDPDACHDTWVRCGMAIHHVTQGDGFELWNEWSSKGDKYPGADVLSHRWHSFGKSNHPATLGTLRHYATAAGWAQPVTFESTAQFDYDDSDKDPLDITGIDLLRPPGFVGDVAQWINQQCRYPRERLAVAAALVSVGAIAGLRHVCDRDETSPNLFAFCIAGSGTGKESIMQASINLLRAAAMHPTVHGAIKSEQEIYRNLIRHQAANYIIDEIGYVLQKLSGARDKGGSPYLEGVIGTLMSAYSKANGLLLLTGDAKEEVRMALLREAKSCQAQLDDGNDPGGSTTRKLESITNALDRVDAGLENPFLSIMGFSTPVTFDSVVTPEQATNGFIARSLIFNERETNPRAKRRFRKAALDPRMDMTLKMLATGGEYDSQQTMIEWRGAKVRVPSTNEAHDLMDAALDYFEDYGEEQKSQSGLEAIVRRAYEMMSKVSLILALPGGIRESEHVRWAFALVKQDIETKISLAYANEHEGDSQKGGTALMMRIQSIIDDKTSATVAYLHNRLKKHSRENIQKALDKMEEGGLVRKEVRPHKGNDKTVEWWFGV